MGNSKNKYKWSRAGSLHHKGKRISHKGNEELTEEELEILKPQLSRLEGSRDIYDTAKRAESLRTKKEEEEIRKRILGMKGGK